MPILGTIASSYQSIVGVTTYEVIATKEFTSDTTTFSFTSIPSTYTHLVIRGNIRSTTDNQGWDDWRIRMNDDTAGNSNYSGRLLWGSASGVSSQWDAGDPAESIRIRPPMSYGTTPNNNRWDTWEMFIFNYASTTKRKPTLNNDMEVNFTSSSDTGIWQNGVTYLSTSAITKITMESINSARQIKQYSKVTLYGIKVK